jgi:hypothetical protein
VALLALLVVASAADAAKPKPRLGRTAVVSPAQGTVKVKVKGARRFVRLRHRRVIPMGSTVDATRGRVRLVTASNASGGTQSGVFYDGAFRISQSRSGERFADLTLVGGRAQECGQTAAHAARKRIRRRLWGRAKGHFRTRGSYSSATVRGTTWLTEDRCDGTLIVSRDGVVDTSDLGGQSFTLNPGQSVIAFCVTKAGATNYCIVVLSQPADGLFGFGLVTSADGDAYDLCVRGPSGTDHCRRFALGARGQLVANQRSSAVVCYQDEGPGEYTARWIFGGTPLGIPLTFTAAIAPPPTAGQCISQP